MNFLTTFASPAAAFWHGVRQLLPMLAGVAPFGVIYGVVALQAGLSPLAAQLMSCILFAGSSQFLLAQMAGGGLPAMFSLGAIGLINLRHALYSASVAPVLAPLPRRWKLALAYLLTDEAYVAAAGSVLSRSPPIHAHWVLLGSGIALWSGWQLATAGGVLLGQYLPTDLDLDFALPLTFIAIVVPMLRTRAQIAAALAASLLAIALDALPYKLGVLCAACGGLLVGALGERVAAAKQEKA
jgi:4-azaleucine resistance transporter AzlC